MPSKDKDGGRVCALAVKAGRLVTARQQAAAKKLYRSADACLGGVCAGVARRFECDAVVVRILALLGALVTLGFGALAYLALWATLPQEPDDGLPLDVSPEKAESVTYGLVDRLGGQTRAVDGAALSAKAWAIVALCLFALFIAVAFSVASMVSGTSWWQFWPVGLAMGGLCLSVVPIRGRFEMLWHAVGIIAVSLAVSCLPMSLGVLSWESFYYAFGRMWPLLVASVTLVAVGAYKQEGALTIAGSLAVALFCLIMLAFYALPGDVAHLLVRIPTGRSFYIAYG